MSARTPEGRITERVIAAIRARPNAWARKVHGGPYGTAGEPDVDACIAGRAVKLDVGLTFAGYVKPSSRMRKNPDDVREFLLGKIDGGVRQWTGGTRFA